VQDSTANTYLVLNAGNDFTGEAGPQGSTFIIKRRGKAKIKGYEISATSGRTYPAICLSFKGKLFTQQEVSGDQTSNVQDYKYKSVHLEFDNEAGKTYYNQET